MLTLGMYLSGIAQGQVSDEYRVKAAFLYNFTKFIEWPTQAFKTSADPIVIGVLGRNPFGDALAAAVAGKTVAGRAFAVRELANPGEIAGCQILFVGSSERKRLSAVLAEVGNAAVLTVGEFDNFTASGGIINFKIESGSVRLQINVEAARRQQLHISAKLLSLAEIERN